MDYSQCFLSSSLTCIFCLWMYDSSNMLESLKTVLNCSLLINYLDELLCGPYGSYPFLSIIHLMIDFGNSSQRFWWDYSIPFAVTRECRRNKYNIYFVKFRKNCFLYDFEFCSYYQTIVFRLLTNFWSNLGAFEKEIWEQNCEVVLKLRLICKYPLNIDLTIFSMQGLGSRFLDIRFI
jgi:hypothetical protein